MDSLILSLLALAATAFIAINLAAFAAFGIDKRLAETQQRRISEAALLQLAFFGGTIGAYAGRQVFRHKTRKKSFTDALSNVTVFQVLVIGAGVGRFWFD